MKNANSSSPSPPLALSLPVLHQPVLSAAHLKLNGVVDKEDLVRNGQNAESGGEKKMIAICIDLLPSINICIEATVQVFHCLP